MGEHFNLNSRDYKRSKDLNDFEIIILLSVINKKNIRRCPVGDKIKGKISWGYPTVHAIISFWRRKVVHLTSERFYQFSSNCTSTTVNVGELTPKALRIGHQLSMPTDIIKLHSNLWHHSPHYSYIHVHAPLNDPTLYYHSKYHNYPCAGHGRFFSLCLNLLVLKYWTNSELFLFYWWFSYSQFFQKYISLIRFTYKMLC